MCKVLYIKANAKLDGESRTFKISDSFIENYRKFHTEDEIITLDLYREGISFLPAGQLDKMHKPKLGGEMNHPILKYAYQFLESDKIVFAEPLWNLSIPAVLKAYIDYICVAGITFMYTVEGPLGLCSGKKAVNITTRGAKYSEGSNTGLEMGDAYLRTISGFLGIADFTTIYAEELDIIGTDIDAIMQNAIKEAENLARDF